MREVGKKLWGYKKELLMSALLVLALILMGVNKFENIKNEPEQGNVSENEEADEEVLKVGKLGKAELPEISESGEGVEPEGNYTLGFGPLTLINANFTVDEAYIWGRKAQLVNVTELYGIQEANAYNGVPLVDPEAAAQLNVMLKDYENTHPGHSISTMSCFRPRGTSCGRLCAATGTSEHHSGYACDLIDVAYGRSLDTDELNNHPEWKWLKENSYRYGFIDRYPVEWAGGSMAEPLNVDANGTTGYYETWHYRYVGVPAATEIATGKYNGGQYDSLEHYLKQTGKVKNLLGK